MPPRKRYLIFTFAFIAAVTGLILLGQFSLMVLLLVGCMIFAPKIVAWVTQTHDTAKPKAGPWGTRHGPPTDGVGNSRRTRADA